MSSESQWSDGIRSLSAAQQVSDVEGGGLKVVVSRVDQLEGAELVHMLCEEENGRAHYVIGRLLTRPLEECKPFELLLDGCLAKAPNPRV